MSKLEERESRRRSATVGKFVEQTPMAATSSGGGVGRRRTGS